SEPSQRASTEYGAAMLPYGLENSERPAKALAHQSASADRSFSVGKRAVFVDDAEAHAQDVHGEVGVFGDGVRVISAGLPHGLGSPGAKCAGDNRDGAEQIKCAPLEILTGNVFERLPARPDVHPISHFGITRN